MQAQQEVRNRSVNRPIISPVRIPQISSLLSKREVEPDPWDDSVQQTEVLNDSIKTESGDLVPLRNVVEQLQKRQQRQPDTAIDLSPQTVKLRGSRQPELGGNKLIIWLSCLMAGTTVFTISMFTFVMMATSPSRQMAEMTQRSIEAISAASKESTNAIAFATAQNAKIAKEASKKSDNSFSLINFGGGKEEQSEPIQDYQTTQASTASNTQVAPQYPVWFAIQGNNLNIRDAPNGNILNTMPIGDKLSYLGETSADGKWHKVRWIESNMNGWINDVGVPR